MDHLEFSKELNSFSFNCMKKELPFINTETKTRVLIGRLYYALVHYYFNAYPTLAASTGSNKHETLKQMILKERTTQEATLFTTLRSLRVWGDYYPLNKEPFPINTARLMHQVNKIIN